MRALALLLFVSQAAITWMPLADLPSATSSPVGTSFFDIALVCAGDGTFDCYTLDCAYGSWILRPSNFSHVGGKMVANSDLNGTHEKAFYSSDGSRTTETFFISEAQWDSVESVINVSRSGHSVTLDSGFYMLCGGASLEGILDTCEYCEFDFCEIMSETLPGPLVNHVAVVATVSEIENHETFFIGGMDDQGITAATYYYDGSGSFGAYDNMSTPRIGHTVNVIPDDAGLIGLLIVVGGSNGLTVLNSAEVWVQQQWFPTNTSMSIARFAHTATWMPSSHLLMVAGGLNVANTPLSSVEMYDLDAQLWTELSSLSFARANHLAFQFWFGNVVIAGQGYDNVSLASVEMYWTATWSPTASPTASPTTSPSPGAVCPPPAYARDSGISGLCVCASGYVGSVAMVNNRVLGCGKGSSNTTSVAVYNDTTLVINASRGVQVTMRNDSVYGGSGTLVITTSPRTNSTVSTVVSIVFVDGNSSEKNITGLRNPIRFRIPLDPGAADPVAACLGLSPGVIYPLCHWLDPITQVWSTSGCETNLSATYIDCSCTHLTDFAAVLPKYNHLAIKEALQLTAANIARFPVGLTAVSIALSGFLVMLLISVRRDKLLTRTKNLKKKRKVVTFWKRFKGEFHSRHTLAAFLWWHKSGASLTSVDRTFVILFTIFFLMTMSALFHAPDQSFLGRGSVIVFSTLAVILPYLLCSYLLMNTKLNFRSNRLQQELADEPPVRYNSARQNYFVAGSLRIRFPECCRWVWYTGIMVSVAIMMWYILTEALMFDQNPHYYCRGSTGLAWVSDFVIQYLVTVGIVEPLILLLVTSLKHWTPMNGSRARELSDEIELNVGTRMSGDLLTIDFSSIEITNALGKGVFGQVDQCIWRGADCAVKRLLNTRAEEEFLHEVTIHQLINPHKHHNVVTFLGVTVNPPGMLLELFPLRSVEDYIIRKGNLMSEGDLCDILTIMITASAGISHLHANGVIHRDIAARNFLIRLDLSASVCDFGLALMLPPGTVGQRTIAERKTDKLPINATAPETLAKGEYSEKSDVFMFGIFIWELLARRTPHADHPDLATRNLPAFAAQVSAGLRLQIPFSWPLELHHLMEACWAQNPCDRPTIDKVNRKLRDFRKAASQQKISWFSVQSDVEISSEVIYYDFCSADSFYGLHSRAQSEEQKCITFVQLPNQVVSYF